MVRFAREDELDRVNELRKEVNDLHVAGKPEIFKEGFGDDLRNYIYEIWNDPGIWRGPQFDQWLPQGIHIFQIASGILCHGERGSPPAVFLPQK